VTVFRDGDCESRERGELAARWHGESEGEGEGRGERRGGCDERVESAVAVAVDRRTDRLPILFSARARTDER